MKNFDKIRNSKYYIQIDYDDNLFNRGGGWLWMNKIPESFKGRKIKYIGVLDGSSFDVYQYKFLSSGGHYVYESLSTPYKNLGINSQILTKIFANLKITIYLCNTI